MTPATSALLPDPPAAHDIVDGAPTSAPEVADAGRPRLAFRRVDGADSLAVTTRRVLRSEWRKLRSVRSSWISLAAAAAVAIGLGLLFSSVAGSGAGGPGAGGGPPGMTSDPVSLSLGGFTVAELIIGCLGVLVVTSEYTTGLVRTTFSAVTNRLTVLGAKAIVLGGVALVVTLVAAVLANVGGQAVYAGDAAVRSLSDPDVLRAVLGTACYATGFGLIGIALGFLLRSTAAAIGTLVGALFILPTLVGLLPDSITDVVARFLPTNAGSAFTSVSPAADLLSPWAGAAVYAAWVLGLLGLAAVLLVHRDT